MIWPRSGILPTPSALLDTPRGPHWTDDASCVGMDPSVFEMPEGASWSSPEGRRKARHAAAVCDGCPVLAACLTDAVEHYDWDPAGTFRGGLTPDARKAWARRNKVTGTGKRGYHRRPTCHKGHDTSTPGTRYPDGKCKECARERAHEEAKRPEIKEYRAAKMREYRARVKARFSESATELRRLAAL